MEKYIKLEINDEVVICSQVFPCLWLVVDSLLAGEMERVLAIGKQGLNSIEYKGFVTQIGRK